MTKAIITDLNRCVGAWRARSPARRSTTCPSAATGTVVRVGPNPIPGGSGQYSTCTCTSCPSAASTARTPSA
ncbi:MAG: hypothetical protein ACLSVD_04685 [Eggerthellaceae bacterium]